MKTFFLILTVLTLTIFYGCQENSITNPIQKDPVDKINANSINTVLRGTIKLEGALNDPYPVGNSYYLINGQIKYEQRTVIFDPMLPSAQRYASFYFITNADLRNLCTVCPPSKKDSIVGFISDVSEDFVPLGGNYVSLYEKTYSIQGREDRMMLKVRFLVTSASIELSAMWLALPNINTEATALNQY
jgi:hypothetical protein